MQYRTIARRGIEILLALLLPVTMTVVAAKNQDNQELPSAEGRLSEYYAGVEMASNSEGNFPFYPGENWPLYPGDEKWNGHFVNPLYPGPGISVYDPVSDGTNIYAGFEDTDQDGYRRHSLARWESSYKNYPWVDLASVSDSSNRSTSVRAVALQGKNTYIGGKFNRLNGQPVSNIAWWNGTKWNSMGGGIQTPLNWWLPVISDIAASTSDVYIVGDFERAGGQPVKNIARWDGKAWYDVGGGLNGHVEAVAVSGRNVYVGGNFTKAGGVPANHIARWDGTRWHALGSGTNAAVEAITVSGDKVYVGGGFKTAGGKTVNNIAYWDGSSWQTLGDGMGPKPAYVSSIVVSPQGVYAAGNFVLEATSALNIAFWDGASWTNLGSGIWSQGADVGETGMALQKNRLYVSGNFNYAGNNESSGFASWHIEPELEPFNYDWDYMTSAGSSVYLIGRYFKADELLTVTVNDEPLTVNDVPLPGPLKADEDGKVYFYLNTSEQAEPGYYVVKLSGAENTASWILNVKRYGYGSEKYFTGMELDLPSTIKPLPEFFLPLVEK